MNERIKKLAIEAGFYANPDVKKFQKFAELIVKESLSALNGMHLWQSVNNQNYPGAWHDAVDQSIDTIKEHFGVEE